MMDTRGMGMLLGQQRAGLRSAANHEPARPSAARRDRWPAAGLTVLSVVVGVALAVAPVVSWTLWFRGRW